MAPTTFFIPGWVWEKQFLHGLAEMGGGWFHILSISHECADETTLACSTQFLTGCGPKLVRGFWGWGHLNCTIDDQDRHELQKIIDLFCYNNKS